MIRIIKKIKNKGPAQYRKSKLSGSGFVMLFAVTLSALVLAIALGVTNIALKEIKFSTSAKDANDAFFAADTGIEFVLFEDKDSSNYPPDTDVVIEIAGLGDAGQGCAKVNMIKAPDGSATKIISKGYNIGGNVQAGTCDPNTNTNAVERQIEVNY